MSTQQIFGIEGVILHSVPFQDYDQILTVFTNEIGCVKVIVKDGHRIFSERPAVLGPLMRAAFLLQERRGEIYRCHQFSPIDTYPQVRQELTLLQTACELLQLIRFSQYPGAPSENLYQFLIRCLEQLPHLPPSAQLTTFFRIKIWKHEGIFNPELFSDCEKPTVLQLANCRSFQEFQKIPIAESLHHKIKQLFLLW
jgi:DNA repair protein RecO (recombination protein O)